MKVQRGLLGSFWQTLRARREVLGTLGGSWAHVGDLLGVSWGSLGVSWGSVGGSWESLGGPWGSLGSLGEVFWAAF